MKRKAILLSIFSMLGLILIATVALQPQTAAGQDQPPTPTPVPVPGDYGDAPDSTNNQGVSPNTAYPSIPGNFPTSWQNTAAGDPAGPVHLNPNVVFLGDGVSGEMGADFGLDQDGANNIVDGGFDNANNDGFDDGWLNQDVPFPHCQRTTLEVRVTRSNAAVNAGDMYLNVWFDGNRSGTWGEQAACPEEEFFPFANEWVVQNDVINVGAIGLGSFQDFVINTARVPNGAESEIHWIRFTLTEDPLPNIARDGRGRVPPAGHDFGETEDYLYTPLPSGGEPGTVVITKTFKTVEPVIPGDVVNVEIILENDGGTLGRTGKIRDLLPDGISYLGPITVNSLGVVSNLTANYNPAPNSVTWTGRLEADSSVRLRFPVEVDYCFNPENEVITNTVTFRGVSNNVLAADAQLEVDCIDADISDITIERRIKTYDNAGGDYDRRGNPNHYLPSENVIIETRITNNSDLVLPIAIVEQLDYQRPDLSPTPEFTDRERQEEFLLANSSITVDHEIDYATLIGEGIAFHPAGQLVSTITVCLLDPVLNGECSDPSHRVQDTPFLFGVEMSDTGDAPDSSNHYGVDMEAYSGVTANFPTVHDPSLPGDPGPIITNTQTLHLGRHSSYEVDADQGPDAIISSPFQDNNIVPLDDLADQEVGADDGLSVANLNVPDCDTTGIPLEIYPTDAAVTYFKNETVDGDAYINVYLDGNRDGDWEDSGFCGSESYSEHIVVNHAINISNKSGNFVLGLFVPTGNVPWTVNGFTSQSRWMRVMITDRPVDLASHGGGDATPYNFGEIEDYLVNNENYPILNPDQQAPVDIGIGIEIPRLSEAPVGFRHASSMTGREHYRFTAGYANLSANPASPTMTLSLDGVDVEIERITIYNRTASELVSDNLTPCSDPTDCAVSLGEIGGGEIGTAQIFFSVPAGTAQNDITIDGAIEDPNDPNPANNKQRITFKPNYLPRPRIEQVEVGDNGSGQHEVTLSGLALPEADLIVGIRNNARGYTTTTTADANGRWSATLDPVELGSYWASAKIDADPDGPRSKPVPFLVTDLPTIASLTVTDVEERGTQVTINDIDSIFDWGLLFNLPPGDYELAAEVQNAGSDVEITLYSESLDQLITLGDFDGDGTYTGEFMIPALAARSAKMTSHDLLFSIKSGQTETVYTAEIGVADDEAAITNADTGAPLAGASITAYLSETGMLGEVGAEKFNLWTDATSGQSNPAVSDSAGEYSFLVAPGSYRLEVNAAGYQPYRTDVIPNAKGLLSSPMGLTKAISAPADASVLLDDQADGQTINIKPGEVIEFVNIGNQSQFVSGDGWSSGFLLTGESYKRQFDTAGTYTVTAGVDGEIIVTVVVSDEEPPAGTSTIFLPIILR